MQAPNSRKMIIHAGFHKTGTTTVQSVLKARHTQIAPHVCVILKSDIAQLCQSALAYSENPDTPHLDGFRDQAAGCFGALTDNDTRPVLISAEDLCGMFPGRRGRIGYPQAPELLSTLISQLASEFAPHLYLSTRDTDPWLTSCYAHNLRHARMRMSRDEFVSVHAGPSLHQIADRIRASVGNVPVTTAALEETTRMAQGPLTPVLDLLGMPPEVRIHLRPTAVANPSLPPDIQDAFLLLNRQEDDSGARSAAKKKLIADYRNATP